MARKGGFIGQDGLNAPDPATGVEGAAGDEQVEVSFTSPSDEGGTAITGYRVTDSTGAHGATGSSSPITVTGLTNGTSYTFNVWAINPFGWSSPSDASGSVSPALQRVLSFGGHQSAAPYYLSSIRYFSISTTGNSSSFGSLSDSSEYGAAVSSTTRAVHHLGKVLSSQVNTLEYVTVATTSNSTDFGDLNSLAIERCSGGDSTRGFWAGGTTANNNSIDYITIASTGNASDFGDITHRDEFSRGQVNSPTRALIAGGDTGVSDVNTIQYVTTQTTGNASDFGDLTTTLTFGMSGCSSTRGVWGGGLRPNQSNIIDYVTIASTGNATDFGDLTVDRRNGSGASSEIRAVFMNGESGPSNVIDYITIASTGNAVDFGDMTSIYGNAATCNAHGGLS
jgi:hypothetical protein